MEYNWQQSDWRDFRYDLTDIEPILLAFAVDTRYITGVLQAMPNDLQIETVVQTMVTEAIKTSEIEGEYLSRQDVVSSATRDLQILSDWGLLSPSGGGRSIHYALNLEGQGWG